MNLHRKYYSVLCGDKGYNDWKITETMDKPRNKLDVDALNLELLSRIPESTRRRV